MNALPLARAAQAASLYQSVDSGNASSPTAGAGDFANLLTQSLGSAAQIGQQAEAQAVSAVAGGGGGLTQVVTAVSRAELALQTTVAVRDRVLQAYQDIIKMPI